MRVNGISRRASVDMYFPCRLKQFKEYFSSFVAWCGRTDDSLGSGPQPVHLSCRCFDGCVGAGPGAGLLAWLAGPLRPREASLGKGRPNYGSTHAV